VAFPDPVQMAPPRRKANRKPLGAAVQKKLPVKGRAKERDGSSRSSGSDSRGSSCSRSSDEDGSSSNSDEDEQCEYKKGGYHPVMPYQLYNARYRVLSKLGAGAFSTVWLCTDEKDVDANVGPELVAMKICKSKKTVTEQAEDEVALLERLQEGTECSPHTVKMCSHFFHSGPHGRHKCMVFEVMGENLLSLVKYYDYNGLPTSIVRRLTRHTLLGLEYIHSRGVIHTDVKLENVLVSRHDFAELLQEAHRAHRAFTEQKGQDGLSKGQKKRMKKKQQKTEPEVKDEVEESAVAETKGLSKSQKKKLQQKRKDAEAEEAASKTVAAVSREANDGGSDEDSDAAAAEACGRPVPPVRQKDRFETLHATQVFAKLADLGNGCREDRQVTDDIQTRQYRSPEVIIGAHWDKSADLWSAGCMFFELLTGDFLFDPSTGENWSRNEDHLALMIELLGDVPPKDYALSGKYSRDFFTNAGKLKHIKSLKYWSLSNVLSSKYERDEEEADEIADFLMPMLAWQPKDRISATEALKHFWVKPMPGEIDVPDPEKFNTSQGSTEAEGVAIEAQEVVKPEGEADQAAKAGASVKVKEQAPSTQVEATEPVPVVAEVAAVEAETPKVAEAVPSPVVAAEPEPSEQAAPSPVLAAEPEPSKQQEPAEADTTQDVEPLQPSAKKVHAAAEPTACAGGHRGAVGHDLLDVSDSTALVGVVDPSLHSCEEVVKHITEAGCEATRLNDRHVLVQLSNANANGASGLAVRAAELARKVRSVSQWISLDDHKLNAKQAKSICTDDPAKQAADDEELLADLLSGDEKTKKKKNNKKKGKK